MLEQFVQAGDSTPYIRALQYQYERLSPISFGELCGFYEEGASTTKPAGRKWSWFEWVWANHMSKSRAFGSGLDTGGHVLPIIGDLVNE